MTIEYSLESLSISVCVSVCWCVCMCVYMCMRVCVCQSICVFGFCKTVTTNELGLIVSENLDHMPGEFGWRIWTCYKFIKDEYDTKVNI